VAQNHLQFKRKPSGYGEEASDLGGQRRRLESQVIIDDKNEDGEELGSIGI